MTVFVFGRIQKLVLNRCNRYRRCWRWWGFVGTVLLSPLFLLYYWLYCYWYYYPPPLLIVIDCYHKTNTRDHPTCSLCRIDPSLYRVTPDLFLSLCVVLVLLVLLLLPMILLLPLLWSWNRYLIWFGRTSLVGRTSYCTYPSLFIRSVLFEVPRTVNLCIRADPKLQNCCTAWRYFHNGNF